MLSKDVCKKCWKYGWGEYDERDWKDIRQVECVECPIEGEIMQYRYVSIDETPPPQCPYKFEHAIAAGSVNIDKDKP